MVFTSAELPKFTTHPAKFVPTVFGGHVLVYESRSHPGHRREFAFKTRFTNQAGISSCYYRCMSCRSMKNKVPPGVDGKPPQIPCIAVKNGYIVNDPDFPEANDHFCVPPTIEESQQKEASGFAKAIVKGRPRQKARQSRATTGRHPLLMNQAISLENLTSSLFSDSLLNLTNLANGFNFNTNSLSNIASTNASSTLTNSEDLFAKLASISNTFGDVSSNFELQSDSKIDEYDNDAAINANNLLASLISSEPALRTDIAVSSHCGSLSTDAHHDQQHSSSTKTEVDNIPTSLAFNSQSSSIALNGQQSSSATSSQRKRKASCDIAYDQIVDRYVKNNWEMPENAGNSKSVVELTCAYILSLARLIPQAVFSMKNGEWSKKDFMGEEVFGKVLAVIGLGRIGIEVAERMLGFGMKVIGYDPAFTIEIAARKGITWMPLERIWPSADYISLHVPLIAKTENMICASSLALCKRGVKIVNVARGGLINEIDLLNALVQGHVAGAALDVFVEEPSRFRELICHPKVICTPHLGASTNNAQKRVAEEIAENIVALNKCTGLYGAINASALEAVLDEAKAQWVRSAGTLAHIVAKLAGFPKMMTVSVPVSASGLQKALTAAAMVGFFKASGNTNLNLVSAEISAAKEGVSIAFEISVTNFLTLIADDISVSGYPSPAGTIICAINKRKMPMPLIALGTLAINLTDNFPLNQLCDSVKEKMILEHRLVGQGHIAIFNALDETELEKLAKLFTVIQF